MKLGTGDHTAALSKKMVDSIGGYLDNLAGAVTNRGSAFEKYADNFMELENSIIMLMYTNKNHQAELQALHEDNSNLKKKVATPDTGGVRRQGNPSNYEFPG